MVLFVFTFVIIKQINFFLKKEVGYNAENVVNIIPPHMHYLYSCAPFVNELKKNPNIESVSEVNAGLFSYVYYNMGVANAKNPGEFLDFNVIQADAQICLH